MTLTKEQIEMYASAADATQTFEMDKGKLIAVEPKHMQELARIALASLEAEAVAYIRDGFRADGVHFCGGIITAEDHERTKPALSDRYNWKHQPLYTAPSAPVVPEEVASAIESLKQTLVDCNRYNYCFDAVKRVEDACRAAMLQGAAGNSPAIPDGWVACSERMPAKGQEVLCTDQFENYETALYDTGYIPGPPFFATTAGEFHPTHWMPLPSAPDYP